MIIAVLESLGCTFQLHGYSKLTAGFRFSSDIETDKKFTESWKFVLAVISKIILGSEGSFPEKIKKIEYSINRP